MLKYFTKVGDARYRLNIASEALTIQEKNDKKKLEQCDTVGAY